VRVCNPALTHPHPHPHSPMSAGSRDRENQGAALEHRSGEISRDNHVSPPDVRVTIAPSVSPADASGVGAAGGAGAFRCESPPGAPAGENGSGSRAAGVEGGDGVNDHSKA